MAQVHVNNSVMATMLAEVEKVVQLQPHLPVIIAIDGNCGSGKTFYADKLAAHFCANVVHCDDFFLPKNMRTETRLNEVGGNIHYERLREVLLRLCSGELLDNGQSNNMPFTYSAYNCSTDSFEERTLFKSNVVIVEGSYALHPFLREFYDLKIVLTVDRHTQLQRLILREGEQGVANFINKWIPLENKYFATLDATDCTVIDTNIYEKH